LRSERMTEEFQRTGADAVRQEPGKAPVPLRAFYGLMPESISHEGYSAKPMHSYWDDFFTLKGLKDAAEIATTLGKTERAEQIAELADDFATTLYDSLDAARAAHGIEYLPGCAELGDFDATSTTIALWPCEELHRLPQAALQATFDRYWERFVARRDDPDFAWFDYTPYELRVVGTFVLLNQPQRAAEALEFFLRDRLPREWNQWPEVVYREPRTARFLGDLPHTWCGSDFLNSVRTAFLYERADDQTVVVFAGLPSQWYGDQPIGFRNLPTYGGRLSCTAKLRDGVFEVLASGDCPVPSGGLRISLPDHAKGQATIDGRLAPVDEWGRVRVTRLPCRVLAPVSGSDVSRSQ
ncbi:MAG: hypothetical protein KDA61_08620, partial [Planctomycetales bacterium]|nr:hypothetical protein [Planctomycetales bacterium]